MTENAVPFTSALANLLQNGGLIEIKNIWFHDKTIKLDGYRFISCRFDKCHIEITSNNFELIDCFVDENTIGVFGNEVAKPIRLFTLRHSWFHKNMPYFAPEFHENGTLTIKA